MQIRVFKDYVSGAISDKLKLISDASSNFSVNFSKWITHARIAGFGLRNEDVGEIILLKIKYDHFLNDNTQINQTINTNQATHFFDLDEKSYPKISVSEIQRCFEYNINKNDGFLHKYMQHTSQMIRSVINKRIDATEMSGYNHLNGSVGLFCAEFSKWANDTAKRSVSEQLEEELLNRLKYLKAIEANQIFQSEPKKDFSIYALIFGLQQMLEYEAIPCLRKELHKNTAVQLFNNLNKVSDDFFTYIVKAIFCLHTTSKIEPASFTIDFNNRTTDKDLESALSSPLGNLFLSLRNKKLEIHSASNLSSISRNSFLTETGDPLAILVAQMSKENQGIHPYLLKEKTYSSVFNLIKILGLLEDFSLFMRVFSKGSCLSGAGGDILMYVLLCQEITCLTACYQEMFNQLDGCIEQMKESFNDIKMNLMHNLEFGNSWIHMYNKSMVFFELAEDSLKKTLNVFQKIANQMQLVRTQDYKEQIKKDIDLFRNTIGVINQRFNARLIQARPSDPITINQPMLLQTSFVPSEKQTLLSFEERRRLVLEKAQKRIPPLNTVSSTLFPSVTNDDPSSSSSSSAFSNNQTGHSM